MRRSSRAGSPILAKYTLLPKMRTWTAKAYSENCSVTAPTFFFDCEDLVVQFRVAAVQLFLGVVACLCHAAKDRGLYIEEKLEAISSHMQT